MGFFDFHSDISVKPTMLISTKATDTIYQEVLHLLEQQGVEEKEPLHQSVLLRDDIFLGYRFRTTSLEIDWLAQHDILVLKNNEGRILHQKQLLQKASESERNPVAA